MGDAITTALRGTIQGDAGHLQGHVDAVVRTRVEETLNALLEASVEAALVELYLAGVRGRRVEDSTEALRGTRVSSGTVSRLTQRIYAQIDAWRQRPITGTYPYVSLDGVLL